MEVLLALVAFIWWLVTFIAICCIWSNTGRTAKALEEMVYYQRQNHGINVKTGRPEAP